MGLLNIRVQPSGREWHPIWRRGSKVPQVTHSCLKVSLTGPEWRLVSSRKKTKTILYTELTNVDTLLEFLFSRTMGKTKPRGIWKVSPDTARPFSCGHWMTDFGASIDHPQSCKGVCYGWTLLFHFILTPARVPVNGILPVRSTQELVGPAVCFELLWS